KRLGRGEIEQLSESMLGPAGRSAPIIDLLERETEGNPFFVVEVVRALAEEAGGLSRVGAAPLPAKVVTGGMDVLVERRLSHIPRAAFPLLQLASLIGCRLDPPLLRHLDPGIDLDGR